MSHNYPVGATGVSINVFFADDNGAAVTGQVAADFPACKWSASDNTADTAITLSDLAAITTAHPNNNTAGGIKEREGGWYRLDLPNNMFSAAGERTLTFAETTGKRILAPRISVGNVPANAVQVGGTDQTGHDLGAGVLLEVGTGPGQLDVSAGKVPATVAAGDGVDAATLLSRLTAARASYLDNLNIGGPVASQADILAINQSASKHLLLATVGQYERPESGSTVYTIECRTFDAETGDPVNADSTPTLTATGGISGDLSFNLSAATNPETGVYRWAYTVAAAAVVEPIIFGVSATIATIARTLAFFSQVVDDVAATFTATDKSNLTSLFNAIPDGGFADETAVLAAIAACQQAADPVTLPNNPPAGFLVSASFDSACDFTTTQKASLNAATPSVTVASYAANQDPWSKIKGAALSGTPAAGSFEEAICGILADQYTDDTTDPTQRHCVYVVAGSGAPGVGHTLATKKLFDTSGAKVTADTQVIGQASE